MGRKILQKLKRTGSIILLIVFLYLGITVFDLDSLLRQTQQLFVNYNWLLLMTVCYGLAFIFRAIAWRLYVKEKHPLTIYISALFYSLFFNHLFPFKVGEVIRIGVLTKQKDMTWDTAMHSVVVMRVLDLLCLGLFSFIGALLLSVSLSYSLLLILLVGFVMGGILALMFVRKRMHTFYIKHMNLLKDSFFHKRAIIIVSFVLVSWVLEAVVLYSTVQAIQLDLSFFKAVWVNSITIASQVFQFAPGGIITYESTMSFALAQVGTDWANAYHIAIITHGYKFLFSFLVGGVAFILHPVSLQNLQLWKRRKVEKS
jgi:uncharacterized membrane protein YbhN (UPF0104 family)